MTWMLSRRTALTGGLALAFAGATLPIGRRRTRSPRGGRARLGRVHDAPDDPGAEGRPAVRPVRQRRHRRHRTPGTTRVRGRDPRPGRAKFHLGGVIYFAWTDTGRTRPDRRPSQRSAAGRAAAGKPRPAE